MAVWRGSEVCEYASRGRRAERVSEIESAEVELWRQYRESFSEREGAGEGVREEGRKEKGWGLLARRAGGEPHDFESWTRAKSVVDNTSERKPSYRDVLRGLL